MKLIFKVGVLFFAGAATRLAIRHVNIKILKNKYDEYYYCFINDVNNLDARISKLERKQNNIREVLYELREVLDDFCELGERPPATAARWSA